MKRIQAFVYIFAMASFLLITGMPGCGKTTLVRNLVKELMKTQPVPRMIGFYTEEVKNSRGDRIGFDVVLLDGKRGNLARVS